MQFVHLQAHSETLAMLALSMLLGLFRELILQLYIVRQRFGKFDRLQ